MEIKLIKIAASDKWYATWAVKGRSFRQSMRTADLREARAKAEALRFTMIEDAGAAPHRDRLQSRRFARALLARLHRIARNGNARRQVTLTEDQLLRVLAASKGCCQVSGIPFTFNNTSGCPRNPWAPSLDRIDSTKPYRAGNVRVVCVAANTAMSDWGAGVLVKLAHAVAAKHGLRASYAQNDRFLETAEMH